jgi:hypothetical protein
MAETEVEAVCALMEARGDVESTPPPRSVLDEAECGVVVQMADADEVEEVRKVMGQEVVQIVVVEKQKPRNFFLELPEEKVMHILSYLRSMDFVCLSEVNKALFGAERISRAIMSLLRDTLRVEEDKLPPREQLLRPDYGYVSEIKMLTAALKSPIPNGPGGYYVSACWLANARKYYEALTLPDVSCESDGSKRKTPQKSSKVNNKARIRQRRGSEALPPWPDMNADITCEHGNLALSKGIRAKRRLVDKRSWHLLRKFYPQSQAFKSRLCGDCPECADVESLARIAEELRREEEVRERQVGMTDQLWVIANRSKGVPAHCLIHYDEDLAAVLAAALDEGHSIDTLRSPPLAPGLYHLVPRSWLRVWRAFVKGDADTQCLPALDSTCMLCSAHGSFIPPPHVNDFLRGVRGKKYLLGGLGDYGGQQYEIITTEEWDALSGLITVHEGGRPDFTVRFSCDGERVTWSTDMCSKCDPFDPFDTGCNDREHRRSRK